VETGDWGSRVGFSGFQVSVFGFGGENPTEEPMANGWESCSISKVD